VQTLKTTLCKSKYQGEKMSEFLNFNLLGLIGAITGGVGAIIGGIALYISYKVYKNQKPDLDIEVLNCEHDLPNLVGESQVKDINFWVRFRVKNIGDRGTKIVDIILSFVVGGKRYQLHERNLSSEAWEITKDIVQFANPESMWVKAHDSIPITANFNGDFDGIEENQIDCTFTICDTHKEYTVTAISKKVGRPPLALQPLGK
jgi:hypothetical protein